MQLAVQWCAREPAEEDSVCAERCRSATNTWRHDHVTPVLRQLYISCQFRVEWSSSQRIVTMISCTIEVHLLTYLLTYFLTYLLKQTRGNRASRIGHNIFKTARRRWAVDLYFTIMWHHGRNSFPAKRLSHYRSHADLNTGVQRWWSINRQRLIGMHITASRRRAGARN